MHFLKQNQACLVIDYRNEKNLLLFFLETLTRFLNHFHSDRFRTTNNMLGDCYTAAVVEHWSEKELKSMETDPMDNSAPEVVADVEKVS